MQQDHPVYIRMGKKGEPVVHTSLIDNFQIGKAITISDGKDVCLLSTGNMLPEAVEAAHKLKERRISAQVVSFHTVKPLDEVCLRHVFNRFKLVATIEEHSLIGGFGAAVSEWLADSRTPSQNFLRFGTPDAFFKKSGEQEYAREMLGLSAHQIADRIVHALH
jgi:transketolase